MAAPTEPVISEETVDNLCSAARSFAALDAPNNAQWNLVMAALAFSDVLGGTSEWKTMMWAIGLYTKNPEGEASYWNCRVSHMHLVAITALAFGRTLIQESPGDE
jgi:hypothetical protein